MTIKLLFICSRNRWRSLTAENVFKVYDEFEVKSAGTEESARIKVNAGHIGWADLIFVMEKKHQRRLNEKFAYDIQGKRIVRLDIPDEYRFMDEDLIDILKSRVAEIIELPS